MDFWNDKDNEYRLKMIDVYNEQVNDLVKILPTFKIANATIHFDETSPHMHIVSVPIIENCTRGMKKQVGKSQLFTKEFVMTKIITIKLLVLTYIKMEYLLMMKMRLQIT